MLQYLHPGARDHHTVGHCICTVLVHLLCCLHASQTWWLAGEIAKETPLRCAVPVSPKLPGCLRSLWAGFGECAGSSPRLLPPVSVQRNRTFLSKCLCCPCVSPASHLQVALRVMKLVLWWTHGVRALQEPGTELGVRGGWGAGGWELASRRWGAGGMCGSKT